MADEVEQLVKIYEQECQTPEEDSDFDSLNQTSAESQTKTAAHSLSHEDDNVLVTRSGNKYQTVPASTTSNTFTATSNTCTTMTNTNPAANSGSPNSGTPSAPSAAPTINVLNVADTIPIFWGEGTDERPYDFIRACEDHMKRANAISDADKITLVRSRLKGEAVRMMNTGIFSQAEIQGSYDNFRQTFLEQFGGMRQSNLITLTSRVAGQLKEELNSLPERRAQQSAHEFTSDQMSVLDANGWIQGGYMSRTNLRRYLEFLYFMLVVREEAKNLLLDETFKPGDRAGDLSVIAQEKCKGRKAKASLGAQAIPVAPVSVEEQSPPPQSYAATMARPSNVCTYCQKAGHSEKKCYKKIKEQKMMSAKTNTGQPSVRPKTGTSSQINPNRTRSYGSAPTKYCIIHRQCKHSTEECKDIYQLRDDRDARASQYLTKQSGEGQRPTANKPD